MSRERAAFVVALSLLAVSAPSVARAQACCAGAGAVTPARLALHEDALVGTTLHVGGVLGTYGAGGAYSAQPPHTSEVDLQQDVFGAVRLFKRAQLAVLVPFVETHRTVPGTGEWGGGVGDINVGARYDFTLAGRSRVVPGIALLAGLTLPTGRPVEGASQALATDATGIGAFQGNAGLALEQTWGAWLANVSGLVAQRASRSTRGVTETLGTQFTALGAVAYSFRSESAIGLSASYAAEGNATIDGVVDPNSHKRALTLSALGLYPVTDALRVQGTFFLTPPLSSLGANQPASAGVTLTLLFGFS